VGKVVAYARRAGDHAFAVFAWAEAARFYEATLDTAEATTLLSAWEQAELHYLAGLSHSRMEVGSSLDHHDKAVSAYHASGDLGGVAQTLLEKTRVAGTIASVPYGTLAELQPLEHAVQTLGSTDPELCGRIWAEMAQVYWHGRQTGKAEELALKALAIGRATNNERLRAEASFGLGLAYLQKLQLHEALASWQETCAAAHEINDLLLQGGALSRMSWTLTCQGRLQEAESVAHQAGHLIEKTHEWSNYALALANLAVIAVIQGNFPEAEKRVQEALVMVSRSRNPWGGLLALLALASLQFYRGAWTEAEDTLSNLLTPGHLFADPGSALDIIAGLPRRLVRAYAHPAPELVLPISAATSPDIFFVTGLCALGDIGDRTNDPTLARSASPMLELAAERGGLVSSGWGALLPRVLGVIASLDRHWETAEARFQTAISTAEQIGAQPELGRSYLDYARMLVRRNAPADHQRAHGLAQ
jgi:tetratricopeptide (TPR) repeat protein